MGWAISATITALNRMGDSRMAHQVGKYVVVAGVGMASGVSGERGYRAVWAILEAAPSVVHWTLIDAGNLLGDTLKEAERAAMELAIETARDLQGDATLEAIPTRFPIPEAR